MVRILMLVILMCCTVFGCEGGRSNLAVINEETLGKINIKIDALTAEIAGQKNEGVKIKSLPFLGFIFKEIVPTVAIQVVTLLMLAKIVEWGGITVGIKIM
jgi:hypothetical protein